MDSGVAAVAGAAVGVAGTTFAAVVAGISAQRQVRAQHRQWRRQLRRDAYVAFTAKADEVYKLLQDIDAEVIRPGVDLVALRERLARISVEFDGPLTSAKASVEIEGPEKMARAAEQFFASLRLCMLSMHAISLGHSRRPAVALSDWVGPSLERASSKRCEFVEHARKAIDV